MRDAAYEAWIRSLPCLICWREMYRAGLALVASTLSWDRPNGIQESPTECAHVGERGLWQKCSSYETVPLCGVAHHRLGPQSHHVLGKRFWEFHGIDREAVLAGLTMHRKEAA